MHGCNAQGKMASGVAKAIRKRWPLAYKAYMEWMNLWGGDRMLGSIAWYHHDRILHVANAITQEFYGKDGKRYASPRAVYLALRQVASFTNAMNLPLYLPRIGCGLGGLTWEQDVEPLLKEIETLYPDLTIFVCDI